MSGNILGVHFVISQNCDRPRIKLTLLCQIIWVGRGKQLPSFQFFTIKVMFIFLSYFKENVFNCTMILSVDTVKEKIHAHPLKLLCPPPPLPTQLRVYNMRILSTCFPPPPPH